MSLQTSLSISDQDARTISSVKGGEKLGQVASTSDGRTYVYSLNGAVALAAGKLTSAAGVVANHINRTGVVYASGTTNLTFTVGATAVTADQYADGYLVVNVGPGQNLYRVVGNTAVGTNGSPTVRLRDPLTVATSTASKFSLYTHPQANVIVNASSISLQQTGVPNVAVTAAYYFWNQVTGYTAILSDGVVAKGVGAIPSDAVDGAVETEVAGTTTQRVGFAPEATVDQEYRPVYLTVQS